MAPNHGLYRDQWSYGRGFASLDPERQREVPATVRGSPTETMPAQRFSSIRGARSEDSRAQVERRLPDFEGSSSRHTR
jgi:hypothetical protein